MKKFIFLTIGLMFLCYHAEARWRSENLTPLQKKITEEAGTEPAFKNEYWNNKKAGIYVDVETGEPLFSSSDKFESRTGWPSFTRSINQSEIIEKEDNSHFMQRIEVRSKKGNNHLGHLFNDGPKDRGGKRYCINSASLKFIPAGELKKYGYEEFLPLFNGK